MHHLLEHIDQGIKGDKAKIRTQQLIKLNTWAKEIQQVNPGGPDNNQSIRPLPIWPLPILAVCRAYRGLPVGFLLLRYSVKFTVESLSLLYLIVIF